MSIAVANQVAKLNEKEQNELLENNEVKNIRFTDVSKIHENKKGTLKSTFPEKVIGELTSIDEFEESNNKIIEERGTEESLSADEPKEADSENIEENEEVEDIEEKQSTSETNFSFSEQEEPIAETIKTDDYNRDSQGRFASVNISLNGKIFKSLKEKETVAINMLGAYRDMTDNAEEIEVVELIEKLLQDILR